MLKSFLALFDTNSVQESPKHSAELATAALFFEVIKADHDVTSTERESYRTLLKKHLHTLTELELDEIAAEGEQHSQEAVDLVQFTSRLNDSLEYDQKLEILQSLWSIALADNVLDKHEEHIIRRMADLLYITHSDYIKAKLMAQGGID